MDSVSNFCETNGPSEHTLPKPKALSVPICRTDFESESEQAYRERIGRIQCCLRLYENAGQQGRNTSAGIHLRDPNQGFNYQEGKTSRVELRLAPDEYQVYEEKKRKELADYEVNFELLCVNDKLRMSPELFGLVSRKNRQNFEAPVQVYHRAETQGAGDYNPLIFSEEHHPGFAKVLRDSMERDTFRNTLYDIDFHKKAADDLSSAVPARTDEILHPSLIEGILNKISLLRPLDNEDMHSFVSFLVAANELSAEERSQLLRIMRRRNKLPGNVQQHLRNSLEQLAYDTSDALIKAIPLKPASGAVNWEGPVTSKEAAGQGPTKRPSQDKGLVGSFAEREKSVLKATSIEATERREGSKTPQRISPRASSRLSGPETRVGESNLESRKSSVPKITFTDDETVFEKRAVETNRETSAMGRENAKHLEQTAQHEKKARRSTHNEKYVEAKKRLREESKSEEVPRSKSQAAQDPGEPDAKKSFGSVTFYPPRSSYDSRMSSALSTAIQSLTRLITKDSMMIYSQKKALQAKEPKTKEKPAERVSLRTRKAHTRSKSKSSSSLERGRQKRSDESQIAKAKRQHNYHLIYDSKQIGFYRPIRIEFPWAHLLQRLQAIAAAYIKPRARNRVTYSDETYRKDLDLMYYFAIRPRNSAEAKKKKSITITTKKKKRSH